MLVDSGADISLLKLYYTSDDAKNFPQKKVVIEGVSDNIVNAYSMCIETLLLPNI